MALVRLINRLSLWTGSVAALIVLPLILAMVYEVIVRYGFSSPTLWAFEISYMMMGSIFILGIAYALSIGAHVNVDFIHNALPKRVIAAIDFAAFAVLAVLATWLAYYLLQHAIAGYKSGEGSGLSAWNPPVWPYRVVYFIGFAMFALQVIAKMLENVLIALGLAGEHA